MSGVYSTAPGLTPLARSSDMPKVLDIDENYLHYIENKNDCRLEDLAKYHCLHLFGDETRRAVAATLVERMTSEYPEVFQLKQDELTNKKTGETIMTKTAGLKYVSVFDALCSQLQEDVAVVQMSGEKDWLTAIHLCSPNHWDPRTKIGRPFNEIHVPVPGIERTVKNYQVMLKMIIDKEPFTRFAWGIATDRQLNHHPETPAGKDEGRMFTGKNTEFYVRTERQNLIGLKAVNAFIFTIRTYFYKVEELMTEEKKELAKAVGSMSEASLEYKGMTELKDALLQKLS
ncbi:MAG TPA: DUF3445 domain-containing protein [Cyclobacteriaceae bacterium]|nr:DUF3445 domain-containing protein [Cyclobacteriaceae bacterium]